VCVCACVGVGVIDCVGGSVVGGVAVMVLTQSDCRSFESSIIGTQQLF
jgi:hypothetical protein